MAFESPRERLTNPDGSLQRLWEKAKDEGRNSLPLRIVVQLYDGKQYLSWRGLSWRGAVESLSNGVALRKGLEAAFKLLSIYGVEAWSTWLQQALKEAQKAQKAEKAS